MSTLKSIINVGILISVLSCTHSALANLKPEFTGKDKFRRDRVDSDERINVELELVVSNFDQPTDIQFEPSLRDWMFVAEKNGKLFKYHLKTKEKVLLLSLDVPTRSELGLLGLAFHPDFKSNRKIYLNYNRRESGKYFTVVSEWTSNKKGTRLERERVLLKVEQPFANHNAGQLAFGPKDGFLYIGLGDGGSANDPRNRAQNKSNLLGKMLRIDVTPSRSKPYTTPESNPFVKSEGYQKEIWALGLRNPWRYSFSPENHLIVADVGQYTYEEITVVAKGENHGWKHREGKHCFEPSVGCLKTGLVDPIYEYGREDGGSITGGYVYTGRSIPKLNGQYIFGDYLSGRIWALDYKAALKGSAVDAHPLGRFAANISTFGKDLDGEIYVADFSGGKIYRIVSRKR